MLPVRFRAIPRRQPFSRAQSRTLISRLSWERSFYSFLARPLPTIVIWPKKGTRAIPRDSEMATLFARPIAHVNIPVLTGALLLQFLRATASNIRYLAKIYYPCNFA